MEPRLCKCGCGTEISGSNSWEYKRGHKPKGNAKRLPPPSNSLAKREPVVEIDPSVEDETEYVDCQISVPQLDTIFNLLQPRSKAIAVLNGLDEEAAE